MRKKDFLIIPCLIICTIFTAIVWYIYYKTYFNGLVLNDAMDYAGIARNVARGQGFISQYLTPLGLAHYGVPQPDMWRAPLWPLALAGFQKIFGFIDEASALGTGFFFIAASPLVFLLARQWFGVLAAAGSVLVYTLTPELLRCSISGMTESMAVFLMLLVILPASARGLKNTAGDWLSGAALGLFYLARYNALLFLPFFLIYRWIYRKAGVRPPARMLAGFFLATSPWLIRNTILFGNPLFSLQKYEPVMFTASYPDYSLYLFDVKVNTLDFIITHTGEMAAKISANWNDFVSSFLSPELNGVTTAVFIVFLVSLLVPLDKKAAGIRPLMVACYLTQLAALLVIHFIPRLFLVFAPLYIIFALGALQALLSAGAGKARLRSLPVPLTLIAILFLSFINYTIPGPPEKYVPDRIKYSKILGELHAKVPGDQVVLTNEGHLVSWYGDRYACKIPYSVDMVPEIKKRADFGALFISDRILWHMPEADRSWKVFWYDHPREFNGFKFEKLLTNRGLVYYSF
ncbi:MAG: ArnT family glycosyltransferase [Bacillota bacterium]